MEKFFTHTKKIYIAQSETKYRLRRGWEKVSGFLSQTEGLVEEDLSRRAGWVGTAVRTVCFRPSSLMYIRDMDDELFWYQGGK